MVNAELFLECVLLAPYICWRITMFVFLRSSGLRSKPCLLAIWLMAVNQLVSWCGASSKADRKRFRENLKWIGFPLKGSCRRPAPSHQADASLSACPPRGLVLFIFMRYTTIHSFPSPVFRLNTPFTRNVEDYTSSHRIVLVTSAWINIPHDPSNQNRAAGTESIRFITNEPIKIMKWQNQLVIIEKQ